MKAVNEVAKVEVEVIATSGAVKLDSHWLLLYCYSLVRSPKWFVFEWLE